MYFWTNTTVTVKGAVWRPTACEKCAKTYFYRAEREVASSVHSPFALGSMDAGKRAGQKATAGLSKALKKATDAVPCPSCGWYQKNMTKPFRELHYEWLAPGGIATCILGGVIALFAAQGIGDGPPAGHALGRFLDENAVAITILGGGIFVSGIGMVVARDLLRSRIEPNSYYPEDVRIQIGKEKALTEEQFLALNPPLPEQAGPGDLPVAQPVQPWNRGGG